MRQFSIKIFTIINYIIFFVTLIHSHDMLGNWGKQRKYLVEVFLAVNDAKKIYTETFSFYNYS